MNRTLWRDALKVTFQGLRSPAEVNLSEFADKLRKNGLNVNEFTITQFSASKPEKQQKIVELLWNLAYMDKKSEEERRDLYSMVARYYEKLFESETVDEPGWFP